MNNVLCFIYCCASLCFTSSVAELSDFCGNGCGRIYDAASSPREMKKKAPGFARETSLLQRTFANKSGTVDSGKSQQSVGVTPRRSPLLEELFDELITLELLGVVLVLALLACAFSLYLASQDQSPVKFYSEKTPDRDRMVCTEVSREAFLRAFNCKPQRPHLRLVGRLQRESTICSLLRDGEVFFALREMAIGLKKNFPLCRFFRRSPTVVVFDVSLDLTPFITSDGSISAGQDVAVLDEYLASCNPLTICVLTKRVTWSRWEDVATNIKHQLRFRGFEGTVDVYLEADEELIIYRNHPWQNFVRSPLTQALAWFSVVGILFWAPYVWLRSSRLRVASKFTIDVDIERYWEMCSAGLHPDFGFANYT